ETDLRREQDGARAYPGSPALTALLRLVREDSGEMGPRDRALFLARRRAPARHPRAGPTVSMDPGADASECHPDRPGALWARLCPTIRLGGSAVRPDGARVLSGGGAAPRWVDGPPEYLPRLSEWSSCRGDPTPK